MSDTDLDQLPPVIQLLLREAESVESATDILPRLKALWPELKRQAEWSITNFDGYLDLAKGPSLGSLQVGLVQGLDPFSEEDKCSEPRCRLELASQLGRSIGLYADKVLVFDSLTDSVHFAKRFNNKVATDLLSKWLVLLRLRPLLEAGLFEFVNPFVPLCAACSAIVKQRVEELTLSVLDDIRSDVSVTIEQDAISIKTNFLGGPIYHVGRLSKRDQKAVRNGTLDDLVATKWLAPRISRHIASVFTMLRAASGAGAITFSNSRVGLMAAQEIDGSCTSYRDARKWETTRSAGLPWIGDLALEQVVQLRQEADSALPRFRERMSQLMLSETIGSGTSADAIAAELAEEAAEVEAELRGLNFPRRARVRNALAVLTVAIYGYAAESVTPGAATGLAAFLHHLHRSHASDTQEYERLISKPGYVLVKAKELARHAAPPERE